MIETFLKDNKLWAKTMDLHVWEDNPRKIRDEEFTKLLIQIFELEKYKPSIITPDGIILGGNMRWKGYDYILNKMSAPQLITFFKEQLSKDITPEEAQVIKESFTYTFVSVVDPQDENIKMKYNLSDNSQAGFTDLDLLKKIYEKYDINWSNYQTNYKPLADLGSILQQFSQAAQDTIPELSTEPPVSQVGEVYQLGNHRLMCGSSIDRNNLSTLMDGKFARVVFTSPPYNMKGGLYKHYEDNLASDEYVKLNVEVINTLRDYLKGFLFWNLSYNRNNRGDFLEIMYKISHDMDLKFLEMIVWNKGHGLPVTAKALMTRQYEDILVSGTEENVQVDMELFYVGATEKRLWFNKATQQALTNYWYIPTGGTQRNDHLACVPVALPYKGIQIMSKKGDVILDPFGGSGTTLIAAEQLDRVCHIMEFEPAYCDVIRKRYAAFTGRLELWKEKILPPLSQVAPTN